MNIFHILIFIDIFDRKFKTSIEDKFEKKFYFTGYRVYAVIHSELHRQ